MEMTAEARNREIGNQIAVIRQMRKMTQTELSIQANCSYQTICRLENGKQTPKEETLKNIASALGIPLSAIKPEETDPYGTVPADLVQIIELMRSFEGVERRKMINRITAIIKSETEDFTSM